MRASKDKELLTTLRKLGIRDVSSYALFIIPYLQNYVSNSLNLKDCGDASC
jgi:hypothetical protein